MFNRDSIQTSRIVATSKMSLKLSCLEACSNDIDKAEKLYTFIVSDLSELPDSDPVQLTGIQQFKKGADEIFAWIGSHQEDISKGFSIINGLRNKAPQMPVGDISPIPKL